MRFAIVSDISPESEGWIINALYVEMKKSI